MQNADEFSPSIILNRVNKAVYNDSKISEVFTTLSILIINKREQKLSYAGAGDVPLMHKNSKTSEVSQIQSKGFLLGFVPEGNYQDIVIEMSTGDSLFLLTDGIIETRNKSGEMFGEERLLNLISETASDENFLTNIQNSIRGYSNDMFEDDISMIFIQKE